jgi:DNA-directed RNA polymerase specialized sigma24 family protein
MGVQAATVDRDEAAFTAFVTDAEPRLRRAFTLLRGAEVGGDATAEALAWAWEHWAEVQAMANPVGYLYRVGSSRTRYREERFPHAPAPPDAPGFEPGLVPALARLTPRQRTAVVLVHGCGWTHQEVADALELSRSSVGTHVERAMAQLRNELGVESDG